MAAQGDKPAEEKPETPVSARKTIRSKTGVRAVHKGSRARYVDRPEICFLLQDWEDGYNVGGMFRLAEAVGAVELVLTGKTPRPDENPMVAVTSMGQHRRVSWRPFDRHESAVLALKEDGWSVVVVEIADGAEDYREFSWPDRCCLVLGNEGAGVYGSVMKHRDAAVYIPMFGKGRSLNVTVAAGIVAFEAVLSGRRA